VTLLGVATVCGCVVVAAAMLFVGVRHFALRRAADAAHRQFAGDDVEALIAKAGAADVPLAERTRAVWALGELGDRRALPALRSLNVQEECDHARLVCQSEVRKAIAKIEGEMSPRHSLRQVVRRVRGWVGR
jgi:HEAT repeat protein